MVSASLVWESLLQQGQTLVRAIETNSWSDHLRQHTCRSDSRGMCYTVGVICEPALEIKQKTIKLKMLWIGPQQHPHHPGGMKNLSSAEEIFTDESSLSSTLNLIISLSYLMSAFRASIVTILLSLWPQRERSLLRGKVLKMFLFIKPCKERKELGVWRKQGPKHIGWSLS